MKWFPKMSYIRNRGLSVKTAVLVTAVLLTLSATAPVALHLGGVTALAAAGLTSVLCFMGAAVALSAGHFLRGPKHVLAAMLIGMAARMGIPIGVGLAISLRGGPLAEAGLLHYLLVFYPVTLAVETCLSLPPARQSVAQAPPTRDSVA